MAGDRRLLCKLQEPRPKNYLNAPETLQGLTDAQSSFLLDVLGEQSPWRHDFDYI